MLHVRVDRMHFFVPYIYIFYSLILYGMQAGDHIQASEPGQDGAPSTSYSSTASGSATRWDAKKRAVKVLLAPTAQYHLTGSRHHT